VGRTVSSSKSLCGRAEESWKFNCRAAGIVELYWDCRWCRSWKEVTLCWSPVRPLLPPESDLEEEDDT